MQKQLLKQLLNRDEITIDKITVQNKIEGQVVLVTGAAGSIGKELCANIIQFNPKQILALDVDESRLFDLALETDVTPIISSILDKPSLNEIFYKYRPNIVFHAAAYKHVPLMELFPNQAITTNILGTYNMANISATYRVDNFVNISTDKAVDPCSVMGRTKKFAEALISYQNHAVEHTKYVSVRFGNVLGSRGSVVPIFESQIKKGGPITITHPDMERYFMLTSEAALLIFQAMVLGEGGEIFALDMGKRVKIVDLAEALKVIHNAHDMEIVYTGLRSGERIVEELFETKDFNKTAHNMLFWTIPEVDEEIIDKTCELIAVMTKEKLEEYT